MKAIQTNLLNQQKITKRLQKILFLGITILRKNPSFQRNCRKWEKLDESIRKRPKS